MRVLPFAEIMHLLFKGIISPQKCKFSHCFLTLMLLHLYEYHAIGCHRLSHFQISEKLSFADQNVEKSILSYIFIPSRAANPVFRLFPSLTQLWSLCHRLWLESLFPLSFRSPSTSCLFCKLKMLID